MKVDICHTVPPALSKVRMFPEGSCFFMLRRGPLHERGPSSIAFDTVFFHLAHATPLRPPKESKRGRENRRGRLVSLQVRHAAGRLRGTRRRRPISCRRADLFPGTVTPIGAEVRAGGRQDGKGGGDGRLGPPLNPPPPIGSYVC